MRRPIPWLLTLPLLAGCTSLDKIPSDPSQTTATWLTIQPFARITIASQEIILVQPSTTFFVYLLGVVAIGAGLYFFRIRAGQRSRLWWGIALVLWGVGALLVRHPLRPGVDGDHAGLVRGNALAGGHREAPLRAG